MSLQHIPHIIPVLSGKGGVGKSSVTVQLALTLCLHGHSVGVLDIDLTGPSIPRLFGIENEKVKQAPGGWLPVRVHEEVVPSLANGIGSVNGNGIGNEHAANDYGEVNTNGGAPSTGSSRKIGSLHCMSLGFLLRSRNDAVIWRGPKKTAMVGQLLTDVLWPSEMTYLLIDTPPGTSDEHISLVTNLLDPSKFPQRSLESSDSAPERSLAAVIVTTPQAISTADVKKELSFCAKVGLRVLGVVENMAGFVCPCCGLATNVFSKGGGEVMAREWGVKFLGSVPLDGEGWGMLIEEGRRPVYGKEVVNNGRQAEDDGQEEAATDMEEELVETAEKLKIVEELLVERYTSCSLCPIFDRIVTQLEKNDAVFVTVPAPAG